MDETIIFPSPNWFQVSGIATTRDNWFIYGGPSKSLCVLKPIDSNYEGVIQGSTRYQAHVVNRAHSEKIISVDVSREWPEKRLVLTGSIDGSVKQWNIESVNNSIRIKSTHSHDIHQNEKEEVSGVGYSSESYAITVGSFGTVVKWELNSNVVNSYKSFLKTYKPNCMACSHHIPLNVAVGTRQGVVFVLDLNGKGKVIYKVRAQDDEIVNIAWCPKFDVLLRKSLSKGEKKSSVTEKLEKIRAIEPEESEVNLNKSAVSKNLPEDSFDESVVEEDDMFDIYKDHESDEFGHSKYVPQDILVKVKEQKETNDFLAECLKLKNDILKKKDEEPSIASLVDALDNTHVDTDNTESPDSVENDEKVKVGKDSDVSSAHTHKHLLASIGKYGAVKLWSKSGKLVASCNVPYTSNNKGQKNKVTNAHTLLWYKPDVLLIGDGKSQLLECNPLKIDCKNKIEWRVLHTLHKRGMYCITSNAPKVQSQDQSEDKSEDWKIYTAAQDRNIVCYSYEKKRKEVIYSTCGGFLYAIHSCPYDAKKIAIGVGDGAVRVWEVDTLLNDEEKMTVGAVTSYWQNVQGKVLTIAWHPTKENLLAFGTGESRIGILDTSGKVERPAKTLPTSLRGGVYSLCWAENYELYACGGGELVIYNTDKPEQGATQVVVLLEGVSWQITAIAWTSRGLLCGSDAGAVAMLNTQHELMAVAFVFNKMVHSIEWHPQQTSSNSEESPYKNLIAVSSLDKANSIVILEYVKADASVQKDVYKFMLPEDYSTHISMARGNAISINRSNPPLLWPLLDTGLHKGEDKLNTWKVLSGHKNTVLQLLWNPHKDEILMSSSQDATVRVWDVTQGTCVSIFGNHSQSSLGITWSAFPHLSTVIYSGGADCCLRVWDYEKHPPEKYTEIRHEVVPKKEKKKNKDKKEENKVESEISEAARKDSKLATALDVNVKKKNYKKFLLPSLVRNAISIQSISKMAEKYLKETSNGDAKELDNVAGKMDDYEDMQNYMKEDNGGVKEGDDDDDSDLKDDVNEVKEDECFEMDFIKLFGTTNEFNELLDLEAHKHLELRRTESYMMLCMFRGHVDALVQCAAQRDALCPFIVSITPCVSFKYWKDVTQMYLAQIERLDAKNEVEKIFDNKHYGGPVYRKVALHLSLHDIKSAVALLLEARLFKEAYVLARARHVDSIAQEVLWKWSMDCVTSGNHKMTAMCHLALGDPRKAAIALARLKEEEFLSLAAKLAKAAGQTTFASHIEEKRSQIQSETPEVEDLKPLPSKIDVMAEDVNVSNE